MGVSTVTHFSALEQVISQILTYVDLTGEGTIESIPDRNVMIAQSTSIHAGDEAYMSVPTPGILVCPGKTTKPLATGNNDNSDFGLPIVIQIVDDEQSNFQEDRIKSHLKWAQNIRQHFHHSNLRNQVWDSDGYIDYAELISDDLLDERLFGFHRKMVQYLHILAISREPHSVNGSV